MGAIKVVWGRDFGGAIMLIRGVVMLIRGRVHSSIMGVFKPLVKPLER